MFLLSSSVLNEQNVSIQKQQVEYRYYNKTAVEKSLTKCFNSNLPKESQMKFVFHTLNKALIHSPRDVLIVTFKSTKWTDTMGNGV